jgi:hypothetical protein
MPVVHVGVQRPSREHVVIDLAGDRQSIHAGAVHAHKLGRKFGQVKRAPGRWSASGSIQVRLHRQPRGEERDIVIAREPNRLSVTLPGRADGPDPGAPEVSERKRQPVPKRVDADGARPDGESLRLGTYRAPA